MVIFIGVGVLAIHNLLMHFRLMDVQDALEDWIRKEEGRR
jgi:hypothetical protein